MIGFTEAFFVGTSFKTSALLKLLGGWLYEKKTLAPALIYVPTSKVLKGSITRDGCGELSTKVECRCGWM